MKLLLLLLATAMGFGVLQRNIVRKALVKLSMPMTGVVDAVQGPGSPAFTNLADSIVYIDAERFRKTPNAFYNVLCHEAAHLKGQAHGDPTPEMTYRVTMNEKGEIQEDSFVL